MRTVFHDDEMATAEPCFHLADEVEVHDGGAVHADEACWVQLFGERLQRLANFKAGFRSMQLRIVAHGVDALDRRHRNETDATTLRSGDAVEVTRLRGLLAHLGDQTFDCAYIGGRVNAFARTLECGIETLGGEWFEQVICCVDFERLQCVVVMRGDEDDGEAMLPYEFGGELEAVHRGHLNIEEDQCGFQFAGFE